MKNRNIKEKCWWEVEVDGKVIGILEESRTTEVELTRWKNLIGVQVRPASHESLIKYNAKTVIPKNLIDKFWISFCDDEAKKKRRCF